MERDLHKGERLEPSQAVPSSSTGPGDRGIESRPEKRQKAGGRANIKLLALDMDGTLLDSQSQVLPSSVEALHAALAAGVIVCLATGKARPAAMAAMGKVGLAGADVAVCINFLNSALPSYKPLLSQTSGMTAVSRRVNV